MIEFVKMKTGIDSNTMYTLLVTIFVVVIPALLNYCKTNHMETKWIVRVKSENDFFFAIVMLYSIFASVLIFISAVIVSGILDAIIFNGKAMKAILLLFIFYGVKLSTKFFYKLNFVRKRLVSYNNIFWMKVMIASPVLLTEAILILSFFEMKGHVITAICNVLLFIIEIIGMFLFRGRYRIYEHSLVDIYIGNEDLILDVDVSKMRKKRGLLIIQYQGREIRIKSDCILKIEYQGEPKVELIGEFRVINSTINKIVQFICAQKRRCIAFFKEK